MPNTINEISSKLINWFSDNSKKVIVALSGGVDSAVVALCAKEALGSGALAITANYKTLSEEELIMARKVADEIGIEHKIIEYDELENSQFVNNDHLRCYYCRNELGLRLVREANKYKVKLIVDGTHKDDLGDNRPGIRALKENGIKIPDDIAIVGFNNDAIGKLIEPALTTINYPGKKIGEIAAQNLINHLKGITNIQLTNSIIVDSDLIIRKSSLKKGVQ